METYFGITKWPEQTVSAILQFLSDFLRADGVTNAGVRAIIQSLLNFPALPEPQK